jgi:hypothetical protein
MGPVARLLDLHDSQRSLHASFVQAQTEDRPGTSEGLYPAIGWAILEYLRDAERSGGFEHVDLAPFADDMAARLGISAADVIYVAQVLATPTEIFFGHNLELPIADQGRPASTRRTALLHKLRRGQHYMLDRPGREALAFAAGYFKWVHAGVEAQKLVVELQAGDIDSFREIAVRLQTRIRGELFDLRRLLEQPEVEELRRAFLVSSSRYVATLVQVARVVTAAQAEIQTPAVEEAIRVWASARELDAERIAEELQDVLLSVGDSNASLQRAVSDFIVQVQRRDRAAFGVPNFDAAAMALARKGPSIETSQDFLEGIFDVIGPLAIDGVEFDPTELRGQVRLTQPRERKPPPRLRRTPLPPKHDRVDDFVSRNRDRILAALRDGPVSLNAWLGEDGDLPALDPRDLEHLVEAVSVFTAPYIIGLADMPDEAIRLSRGEVKTWRLADGWSLRGPDLTMELVHRGHRGGRR